MQLKHSHFCCLNRLIIAGGSVCVCAGGGGESGGKAITSQTLYRHTFVSHGSIPNLIVCVIIMSVTSKHVDIVCEDMHDIINSPRSICLRLHNTTSCELCQPLHLYTVLIRTARTHTHSPSPSSPTLPSPSQSAKQAPHPSHPPLLLCLTWKTYSCRQKA